MALSLSKFVRQSFYRYLVSLTIDWDELCCRKQQKVVCLTKISEDNMCLHIKPLRRKLSRLRSTLLSFPATKFIISDVIIRIVNIYLQISAFLRCTPSTKMTAPNKKLSLRVSGSIVMSLTPLSTSQKVLTSVTFCV